MQQLLAYVTALYIAMSIVIWGVKTLTVNYKYF